MAETALGGTIGFLAQIGVYDVVLPFLLVFTLLFAFLEKTKVLGVEVVVDAKGTKHTMTRKNLNSMIAFTVAFFVIASSQLVRIISEVMANTLILVVAGLCFMLAIGVSHSGNEELDLESFGKGWKTGFWIFNLVGIILILFNALGWLEGIYQFLVKNWQSADVATVLMVLVFVGFMVWVTSSGKVSSSKDSEEKKTE